jgi:hypothetical protein
MQTAAIILILAAFVGAFVASYPLRGFARPPTPLAILHGLIAATGLGLLIKAHLDAPLPGLAGTALWVLVLAALGGATMFLGFHLRGKPLPKLLVVGHALIAATGLTMLWVQVLRS